jgi:hypothetical protein
MAKTSTTKKQTSTKTGKVTKTGKQQAVKSDSSDSGARSFRAIYKTLDGTVVKKGRYCGQKPKQAACKALTAILNSYKEETGKTYTKIIHYGVVETTRGSRHKNYWYSGERCKVTTVEVPVKGNDKPIIYRYNNIVMKASEDDCKDLLPGEDGYNTKSSKKTKTSTKDTKTSTKDKKTTKVKKETKETKETKEKPEKKAAPKKNTSEKKSVKKVQKKTTVEKKPAKKPVATKKAKKSTK